MRAMSAGRVVVGAGKSKRPRMPRKAVMEVTETAAARINELLTGRRKTEECVAVRVGIKSRGCNGLSYTMNYANDKPKRGEEEVEQHGVRVYVEPKALMHIIGTTMDYVQDELSSEFVFHNPNAEAACGCGESFTTKKPEGEGHEAHGGGGDS